MKLESIQFTSKKVYLAPYNNLCKKLEIYLKKYGVKVISYIDNYKEAKNIITSENIVEEYDYIFLFSPIFMYQIMKTLPKEKLYLVNSFSNEYYVNSYNKFILRDNYIKNLENKHLNKRAFVIANGPSLKINDIKKIKNEITFAANKIWFMFEETVWRPTYYSVVDKLMMEQNYKEIEQVDCENKFYADFLISTTEKELENGVYFKTNMNSRELNLKEGIYTGPTVVYTMISIAIYMGIKEIYIIGLDHSFKIPEQYKEYEEDNKVIVSQGEKNHFHKDYIKVGERVAQPEVDSLNRSFYEIHELAKSRGVKIYNASRQSKLNEFDFVNLDEVI